MTRQCTKCGESKPLERFSKRKNSLGGLRRWCKDCANVNSKEQIKADPKKYKEVARKTSAKNSKRRAASAKTWAKNNPDRLKDTTLKRYYGISLDDYRAMHSSQNGKCAICSRHESEFNRPLYVDHCHITGKVRGLLCPPCNKGIGFLKDSSVICDLAAVYLRSHEV